MGVVRLREKFWPENQLTRGSMIQARIGGFGKALFSGQIEHSHSESNSKWPSVRLRQAGRCPRI